MLRRLITDWLAPRLERIATFRPRERGVETMYLRGGEVEHEAGWSRPPDFVVGGWAKPYLLRWFLIPRNPVFNVYLHLFLRSDDDRALHDHPWVNLSILLAGRYVEETIRAGGIHRRTPRQAGQVKLRSPWAAHRIELTDGPCLTLFITGPRLRSWGFHCAERGWVDWKRFTKAGSAGEVGPGCDG
jgi:hypothetical protein